MRETNVWSEAIITINACRRSWLLEHLLRLDAETRLQRFCHLANDAYVHRYVCRLDFAKVRVIGCFDAGAMRGAAELRPAGAAHSGIFEAAFSVEKAWQGRGIGTALILRAISVARQSGGRQLLVECLASSDRMRRILAQFDTERLVDHDDWQVWLPLRETVRDRKGKALRALQGSAHPRD
jgi:GNAT superfamily N-acetyltransferase